jgi:hypothetical protein
MKYYMTGQDKGDCLIEVTSWAGSTVPMQSVPITTNVVSSNSAQTRCTYFKSGVILFFIIIPPS